MNGFYLRSKLVGHRWTSCFVFRIQIATKSFSFSIEDDCNVAVGVTFYQTADHVDHAFDCAGWLLLAIHQRGQGMECAEQIGRTVY